MPLKKSALKNSRLYLILDKTACGRKNTKRILKRALQGGVDIVQFRDKFSSTKKMAQEARRLLPLCRKYHVPFIINDRLEVALQVNADGLHIGQEDMPPALARKILGEGKIIGLSCHSIEQVKRAQKEKCDYMGFGPVFRTATKPNVRPIGVSDFIKALKVSRKPIFAIGGITESRIFKLFVPGKTRIAVCRELCLDKNIAKKAQHLKMRLSISPDQPTADGINSRK